MSYSAPCTKEASSTTHESNIDNTTQRININDMTRGVPFIEDVALALNAAKSHNKVLIVCCEEAESVSNALWANPNVIDAFAKYGVGLLIRENTLPFHQFTVLYPVIAFPCLYCINPQNGKVLRCKHSQDVTVEIVVESIIASSELMQQQKQQQEANNGDENNQNAEAKAQELRSPAQSGNNLKSVSANHSCCSSM